MILKIDAEDLARIVPFCAEQDVRYYLNGVSVEPHEDGAILVATDGHMLAAIQSPDSFVETAAILAVDRRFKQEIRKAGLKRGAQAFVELASPESYPEIRIMGGSRQGGGGVAYVSPKRPALIDGKYPEWRKIIPKDEDLEDGLTGSFNANYLDKVMQAASLASRGMRYNGVRIQHNKNAAATAPLVIRAGEGHSLLMLIMPMRLDIMNPLPTWTRAKPEPEKPAAPVGDTAEPVAA
jgi:DNA polymerase III sliding clamp (beta) subunit (PCNA family)